jgi:type IV secretory pathway TrbD component
MQFLKAGVLYFALVFGAGFVLGPIRILWVVPRFGTRMAELMETPIMFVVILVAARWIVRRFAVPSTPSSRLGMGCIALGLLLVAEFTLVLWLRGLSISDYLANRDPVSATVYYVMLGVFAIMPLLVARRRDCPSALVLLLLKKNCDRTRSAQQPRRTDRC